MTLRDRLNRFPPFLCRLVARKANGKQALSLREISDRSGLGRAHVIHISRLRNWDALPLATIEKFCAGCGVNLLATRRHVEWLKRSRKKAWRGREASIAALLKARST